MESFIIYGTHKCYLPNGDKVAGEGVVLSNAKIIETSKTTCEYDGLKQSDEDLAYLPMAWVGEIIF